MANNNVWIVNDAHNCKRCKQFAVLFKFFHIIKKSNKEHYLLILMCGKCLTLIGYKELDEYNNNFLMH